MTLIRCPDCGRNVSDAAQACPTCGRPMRRTGGRGEIGATTSMGQGWSYEYRSQRHLFGLPLVHVIYGPAWAGGLRPAKAIFAFGNIAIGLVAFGGIAVGAVAVGGIAIGLISLAGIAFGLVLGLGGIATGYWALGGIALGVTAIGSVAFGAHTLQNDPELARTLRGLLSW